MERPAMEDAVETEVDLPESLFHRAEELAAEMQLSRNALYALALEGFIQRMENARAEMKDKLAVLLVCLCLAGCGGPGPVTPTATPAPAFPAEALNASWQLDYVLVNGERQPPYHAGQCLAVSARPEQYYFFDGCNHGYCDTMERRSADSKGDLRVMCSITVQGCIEGTPPADGRGEFVKWDKPFHEALMGSFRAEAQESGLWVHASTKGNPTLVFKRMAGPCEAQASYLKA